MIDVTGAAALHFADPVRYKNVWREADADMVVRSDTADGVEIRARRFNDLVYEIVVEPVLDRSRYHRQIRFCMPGDVKVDLGIEAVGHRSFALIRTLKRPMKIFALRYHVLKEVANCPSGDKGGLKLRLLRGRTVIFCDQLNLFAVRLELFGLREGHIGLLGRFTRVASTLMFCRNDSCPPIHLSNRRS